MRVYHLVRKFPGVRQVWRLVDLTGHQVWTNVPGYATRGGLFGRNMAQKGAKLPPEVEFEDKAYFSNLLARIAICEPRLDSVSRSIVLVNNGLSAGGAERQIINTLLGLKARGRHAIFIGERLTGIPGQDFHLASALEAGLDARPLERLAGPGLNLFESVSRPVAELVAKMPPDWLLYTLDMVRTLRGIRPQVVHLWQDDTSIKCAISALIAGVPRIVLSGRNVNPTNFAYIHQPYMRAAYRALLAVPNVVFSNNSRAGAKSYADWLEVDPERIRVIHNGLDTSVWPAPNSGSRTAARQELDVPDGAPLVLGVFRLSPEKRPLLWIDVAAATLKLIPEVQFVMAGDGDMRREILARVSRLGLAGRVQILGARKGIEALFMAADAFLLTSENEGIPNVLLEAQWYGRPALVTPAGGATEAVNDGVTGKVSLSNEVAAIARDLAALLADKELAARTVSEGPAFVKRAFGLERMIDETLDLYEAPRHVVVAHA